MDIFPLDQVLSDKRMVLGRVGSAAMESTGGLLVLVPGLDVGDNYDAGRLECGRLAMVVYGQKDRLALLLTDAEARRLIVDLAQYYSGIVAFETLQGVPGHDDKKG